MSYEWSFYFLWEYRLLIFEGVLVTIAFTIGTNLAGMVIGLLVGLGRRLENRYVVIPLVAYIELFRCTPLLVQLVWVYYALPMIIGVDISAYTAAALTLSLYVGAFYAEIFRGGVAAIDRGQWDAANAIGMRRHQVLGRIILPQAFRLMIPPIISQTVLQLKNTSLISTIAVGDLLYQGTIIASATYRPLEVYTLIALVYFSILFPATIFARRLEIRLSKGRLL